MKTSEVIGPALDWAVAKCGGGTAKPSCCFDCPHYEERQGRDDPIQYCHHPKMNFEDGSSAIRTWPSYYKTHEQCPISDLTPDPYSTDWAQGGPIIEREKIDIQYIDGVGWKAQQLFGGFAYYCGPTPLVAAMRCYVASKLGDEVEIPEEIQS